LHQILVGLPGSRTALLGSGGIWRPEKTFDCAAFGPYGFGNWVAHFHERRAASMLMTIFVILMVLWLLGIVTAYTLYGYIHILLVIAVAVLLIRVIQGRRVL
jgi:hypothetical protein